MPRVLTATAAKDDCWKNGLPQCVFYLCIGAVCSVKRKTVLKIELGMYIT